MLYTPPWTTSSTEPLMTLLRYIHLITTFLFPQTPYTVKYDTLYYTIPRHDATPSRCREGGVLECRRSRDHGLMVTTSNGGLTWPANISRALCVHPLLSSFHINVLRGKSVYTHIMLSHHSSSVRRSCLGTALISVRSISTC